ncbi:pleckstrin homology domain-containing family A member 5 isoform X4 [Astyanax mexicanus]|uniref:pleckstrin homology domain-containing family A member 5 isoform X4 n=1 Tax=Astyanax mexicanus TaxID=7994 RepID=UPI0020CAB75B|nr:pleckstrin homology domain-containing family A member 5 isoform X4 [Astyanax mexicanus]
MAADLKPDWLACLPSSWSYGVTRDGRVFFINEEAKSTTWLHPVTGEAVITGHRKTTDLPTGWEEGYTFEGARCFINHNERKVTCKHPVSGTPSQDNCIFVLNEQPAPKAPASEKKERPTSTMSEASNYTGGSDYTTYPSSPTTSRPSRSSKKVHNFGKRSNSIKRNPNAPVVKSNWLYKQDSAGMKMWKKRWFVLCDMCLFYYRDEKEEGILGSILLPSFHISMLSVDDHISKKYAFKATHPNMRTYYFCTDTAKEMESWMKVMTDAALVHTEPVRRLEKVKVDPRSPQELNNMLNHRVLTRPEIQNNERNRESFRQEEKKQKPLEKQPSIREQERSFSSKDSQKEEKISLQRDGQKVSLQRDTERLVLQKDGDRYALQKDGERYTLQKDGEKYLLQKDGQKYTLHKNGERCSLQKDGENVLQKDGGRQKEREKTVLQKDREKPSFQQEGEKYGFQKETSSERPITKINTIKLQPVQSSTSSITSPITPTSAGSSSRQTHTPGPAGPAGGPSQYKAGQVNGEQGAEPDRTLSRSDSMQQLELWVRMQRNRAAPDDDTKSITSYQTLPRNMPSHRAQVVPRYPEGYRTLPRNLLRPDSICSVAGSLYDRALPPANADKRRSMRDDTMWQLYEWQQRQAHSRLGYGTLPSPKTMGRIAESIPSSPSHGSLSLYPSISPNRPFNPFSPINPLTPTNPLNPAPDVSSPVLRGDASIDRRHRAQLAKYSYLPDRRSSTAQNITPQSLQGKTPEELTLLLIKLRRQQAELNSVREHTLAQLMQLNLDTTNPKSEILSHHLQRNLMYMDSQMSPEDYRENTYPYRPEELDVDTKLSRLCEQGKVVRTQEEKLQQLHREKHTLETALLSASQEIEMSAETSAAVQSVIQQRDVLQSGLLSTCRELSRVNAELDRSWREYDKLEADVTLAKRNLLEQLEALGSPQTEPPSQQHVQIQKELWRIQDVMEALGKNKPKRSTEPSFPGANPISSLQKSEESDSAPPRPPLPQVYEGGDRPSGHAPPCPGSAPPPTPRTTPHRPEDRKAAQRNGAHSGPDYRLYKSEPELTTVAEVDESNGEEKSEQSADKDPPGTKGMPYPVGIVSPRTKSQMPESSTIASYVTLRKNKKPDPRTDRPHSAVEHMVEGARQRMSVEEQMERIRRHQQGALRERERRREEGALSHSHSFTKDHSYYYTLQTCSRSSMSAAEELEGRRKEVLPVGEAELMRRVATPKEKDQTEILKERKSPEIHLLRSPDHLTPLPTENSVQTAVMVRVGTEEEEEEEEEKLSDQNQDQIIKDSFDLTPSKLGTLVSVNSLSSPPASPGSSPPCPQLPDGSHFISATDITEH